MSNESKPLDLDALEAKARAATPGPYDACRCGKCGLIWSIPADAVVAIAQDEMEDMPGFSAEQRNLNAAYAAAASPDIMMALIAALAKAERDRDALQMALDERGEVLCQALEELDRMRATLAKDVEQALSADAPKGDVG